MPDCLITADVGQESQSPAIDTDQRHTTLAEGTRGMQHGAVTTEHHDQISPLPDRHVVTGGTSCTQAGNGTRSVLFYPYRQATRAQERCDFQDGVSDSGVLVLADERDGAEGCFHARIKPQSWIRRSSPQPASTCQDKA